MGGQQSKQTIRQTADVLSSATMKSVGSCVTMGSGQNVIDVYGTGNIVDGVRQTMSLSVSGDCVQKSMKDSTVQTKIAQQAAQEMVEKGVAGLGWTDAGTDDQEVDLTANIKTMVDMETIQTCTAGLDGRNVLRVAGTGNIVRNVAQDMTGTMVSNCMLQGAEKSQMATDLAQTSNQKSTRIMENPLQPFADALSSIFKGPLMIMAAVFVLLIIAAIAMKVAEGGGAEGKGGASGALDKFVLEKLAART